MYRSILLPTDGSALSDSAVKKGIEFAKFAGASVVAADGALELAQNNALRDRRLRRPDGEATQ